MDKREEAMNKFHEFASLNGKEEAIRKIVSWHLNAITKSEKESYNKAIEDAAKKIEMFSFDESGGAAIRIFVDSILKLKEKV